MFAFKVVDAVEKCWNTIPHRKRGSHAMHKPYKEK